MTPVYILGGTQTDFARNWAREGLGIPDMFAEALFGALEQTGLDPAQIDVAHVGNFVGELFAGQGLLGGLFAELCPALTGLPSSRHEAACASGSMAVLAAMRDIEAGHYQLACVMGLELMRNVDGRTAAQHLGAAALQGGEATQCEFPWPYLFNQILDAYDSRYGIDTGHLSQIAQINFANAQRNPLAQCRDWQLPCAEDWNRADLNPVIEGRIRKLDCGQISDGAACVFLASETVARAYAKQQHKNFTELPRIKGWGHRSAAISLQAKLRAQHGELLFPHVAQTMQDALQRAAMARVTELDGLETHDCFSITEYMAIDHIGLTPPGQSGQAIDAGRIARDGDFPINPSGGLIGLGHPVGATGVRMLLDCANQVTGQAGDCQISAARNMATLNLGGSATTCASFVVGCDA